jgi:hypothetical protein
MKAGRRTSTPGPRSVATRPSDSVNRHPTRRDIHADHPRPTADRPTVIAAPMSRFAVPENPALTALIADAAARAGSLMGHPPRPPLTASPVPPRRRAAAPPPIEHPTLGPTALRSGDGVVAAVVKELRTPSEERSGHGVVAGFVPYDFRVPTVARLRERVWAPEDEHLLNPQPVRRRVVDAQRRQGCLAGPAAGPRGLSGRRCSTPHRRCGRAWNTASTSPRVIRRGPWLPT